MFRSVLAAAVAAAVLVPAAPASAEVIEGYPRCVTQHRAAQTGEPVTPRGVVCAAPLRHVGGEDWVARSRAVQRWDYVGRVYTGVGVPAANLYRRPLESTVGGMRVCVVTRWAVVHYGLPRTRPGEWCAVRAIVDRRTGMASTTWVPSSWHRRYALFNPLGEWVGDAVRRPA